MDYTQLLQSLSSGAQTVDLGGLAVEIRNCADRRAGYPDPRTEAPVRVTRAEFEQNLDQFDRHLHPNIDHLFGPRDPSGMSILEILRHTFGWVTEDLSHNVSTQRLMLSGSTVEVPIWKYAWTGAESKDMPCMVFFHGGGFFGGEIPTTENQCRLLAERMQGVVFSVDYPLCPEYPYPAGFDACWQAVKMVYEQAQRHGVDRGRIGVFGDSAGGNFALVVSIRDRNEKTGMICFQSLIYPTVVRTIDRQGPYWFWSREDYDTAQPDPWLESQIAPFADKDQLNEWYIPGGDDINDVYLNPIADSLIGLPPTLVMTAEYDYLRAETEGLCRKLIAAGNDTRYIRYGGITHGTFDRLGYAPQVEDMILEIARKMRKEGNA